MANKTSQVPQRAPEGKAKPTLTPPMTSVIEQEIANAPLPIEDITGQQAAAEPMAPTFEPPAARAVEGITGTWISGKKVSMLWANSANRNVWLALTDIGWRKFADNSDSAAMAFTVLAANAKATQGQVSVREEADGKIYEIYVW
ncbi:hypothetical protein [Calidithermus chliarophilus]|uniref:hypothetical protein n=1 Tax=Calidithermus chliarophilus TaxID=52023 RepID=UPI0004158A80|nr:hypothetical protein [Calidithermus chliarophilus]